MVKYYTAFISRLKDAANTVGSKQHVKWKLSRAKGMRDSTQETCSCVRLLATVWKMSSLTVCDALPPCSPDCGDGGIGLYSGAVGRSMGRAHYKNLFLAEFDSIQQHKCKEINKKRK